MIIKDELQNELNKVITNIYDKNITIPVIIEKPPKPEFGDYATTLPLLLAKILKRSPKDIGEEIKRSLNLYYISTINVTDSGYLNFFLSREYLESFIKEIIISEDLIFKTDKFNRKKALVEFISANPTGPVTVANARGGPIGDTISNLLNINGYSVEREFYVNDVGSKIIKLANSVIYYYKNDLGIESEQPEEFYPGEYIKDIAKLLYNEFSDSLLKDQYDQNDLIKIGNFSLNKILESMKKDLSEININFDNWFMEHTLHDGFILETINILKNNNFAYEADGAVWFKSTNFGDDKDRVLIRSDKSPTYLASDIAYHRKKFDRGYDLIVDIWGADQSHYKALKYALEAIGCDTKKLQIVTFQLVHLFKNKIELKMSKSTGDFIPLKELIDEIGPDLVRFIFLTRSNDSHLNFDMDVAKSKDPNNPVFYAQYAYTRCKGILREAEKQNIIIKTEQADLSLLDSNEEDIILRKISMMPDLVYKAFLDFSPNVITNEIISFANLFHNFYEKCRVIGAPSPEIEKARLALIVAMEKIFSSLFKIIGIKAPERM